MRKRVSGLSDVQHAPWVFVCCQDRRQLAQMRQGQRQGSNTETCHSQSSFRAVSPFRRLRIQHPVTLRFSGSWAFAVSVPEGSAPSPDLLGRQTFFAHPTGSTCLQFLHILQPTPRFSLQPSFSTHTHLFPHYPQVAST